MMYEEFLQSLNNVTIKPFKSVCPFLTKQTKRRQTLQYIKDFKKLYSWKLFQLAVIMNPKTKAAKYASEVLYTHQVIIILKCVMQICDPSAIPID